MLLLSEAIRLGAMLRPQGRGIESADPRREATCALGAAAMAAGLPIQSGGRVLTVRGEAGFTTEPCVKVPAEWVSLMTLEVNCPSCGFWHEHLAGAVAHLNDDHEWTRELIADWVESFERERGLIPQASPLQFVSTG